jgi:hypothetical protein
VAPGGWHAEGPGRASLTAERRPPSSLKHMQQAGGSPRQPPSLMAACWAGSAVLDEEFDGRCTVSQQQQGQQEQKEGGQAGAHKQQGQQEQQGQQDQAHADDVQTSRLQSVQRLMLALPESQDQQQAAAGDPEQWSPLLPGSSDWPTCTSGPATTSNTQHHNPADSSAAAGGTNVQQYTACVPSTTEAAMLAAAECRQKPGPSVHTAGSYAAAGPIGRGSAIAGGRPAAPARTLAHLDSYWTCQSPSGRPNSEPADGSLPALLSSAEQHTAASSLFGHAFEE